MFKVTARRIALALARRRQKLGQLARLESPTYIARTVEFAFHNRVSIGRYCRIGPHCHLDGEGGLEIGNGTILAPRVTLLSGSHSYKQAVLLPYDETDDLRPVTIGAGVWIGYGAIVMPGVTIDDGSIIGAGSVVTKSVGMGEIVAGNPAKRVALRPMKEHEIKSLVAGEHYFLKELWNGNAARSGRKTKQLEIVGRAQ